MRALKTAGAVLGVLIVILALVLAVGIPSGFLTSRIQERVEQETGYQLTIAGATRLSVWPSVNVTLNDITLKDPKDRDGSTRLTIGSVQADMTLASAWSGQPDISELVITRPTLYLPLRRHREPAAATRGAGIDADAIRIGQVTVSDGVIIMSNPSDRIENRIEGLNVEASIGANRVVKLAGSARGGDAPIKFDIKATLPPAPIERQTVPVELSLKAQGLLSGPLTARAEVRLNGQVVMINGVTGRLDDGAFNGWASVDVASKPLVKLDLDFQRLGAPGAKAPAQPAAQPWSSAPFNLAGLNYVDAQMRISAADINIADGHFGPAASEATLAGGVLKISVSNLAAYGGQASGEMIIDATTSNPTYAMHCDLAGVRALPLLSSLADFNRLDGKMQAKVGGRSQGASPLAVMSNLSGAAFLNFQDGAIRGVNVARMIRALTTSPLSGWQETQDETTDLTQLSASFKIDRGQATTGDLNLIGPLVRVTGGGMVDLGNKSLALRVEPKLVMTTEGQGRTSDPVGLGIPVVIDGPWASPHIYPDMAGMLDNPDAAYAKLKDMGKGLFGANGAGLDALINGLSGLGGSQAGSGTGQAPGQGAGPTGGTGPNGTGANPLGGSLGETIGNLIQQGMQQGTSQPGKSGRSRGIPAPGTPPQADPAPVQNDPPPSRQDSQPMNDVLKQLFGR